MTTPRNPPTSLPESVHSTPQSVGSGTHGAYEHKHQRVDQSPFLVEDLRSARSMLFEEFLAVVLDTSLDKASALDPTNQAAFEAAVKDYIDPHDNSQKTRKARVVEADRYPAFTRLCNAVLNDQYGFQGEAFTSKNRAAGRFPPMQMCRNDPQIVVGSAAKCKPDCALVSRQSYLLRIGPDNMIKDGPAEQAFHWGELISFWELKLENHNLWDFYETEAPFKAKKSSNPPKFNLDPGTVLHPFMLLAMLNTSTHRRRTSQRIHSSTSPRTNSRIGSRTSSRIDPRTSSRIWSRTSSKTRPNLSSQTQPYLYPISTG